MNIQEGRKSMQGWGGGGGRLREEACPLSCPLTPSTGTELLPESHTRRHPRRGWLSENSGLPERGWWARAREGGQG